MRLAVELLVSDQPHVSLMDQRRGVEGVSRPLGRHPRSRELSQLVVDEREQVGRGLKITGRGGFQELSDLGHLSSLSRFALAVRSVEQQLQPRCQFVGQFQTP